MTGEPTDFGGAKDLAAEDTHQSEHWALGLVGAGSSAKGKGADRGIDGRLYFHDEAESAKTKQMLISVKSGKVVVHVEPAHGVCVTRLPLSSRRIPSAAVVSSARDNHSSQLKKGLPALSNYWADTQVGR